MWTATVALLGHTAVYECSVLVEKLKQIILVYECSKYSSKNVCSK